jgi:hypothetical protein
MIPAPRYQGDGRSLGRQPPGRRRTDPAARPGNQGDRVLKPIRHGAIIACPVYFLAFALTMVVTTPVPTS